MTAPEPRSAAPVRSTRRRRLVGGAAAGLVALLVLLGVAELVAIAAGPDSAPSIAIGQNAIAHTPEWLKEFAIRRFGEHDKTALLTGIYAVLAVLAAAVGALAAVTRRMVALVAVAALGIVAAISAARYPVAGEFAVVPALAGAVVGAYAYATLIHDPPRTPTGPLPPDGGAWLPRRRLLVMGGGLAVVGAGAYAVGRVALQGTYNAIASRAAVRLPPAGRGAGVPTAGTGFDVPGLSPYITPIKDFYRVDTALVVPQLDTAAWRLRIHGMVDHPLTLTYQQLTAMPQVERAITLTCVSQPVGGPYVGNAVWQGVLLKPILDRAGISPDADQLFMTSTDGMTIGADLAAATDGRDAMLAVGMNGEPLPFEHGFPVRMVIPGLYGYVSATKWLTDLEVTTYAARRAYWVPRGYSAEAPVKLESRIDTPSEGAHLQVGTVTVAGVAWQQHVGIANVEVCVDEGPWLAAELGTVASADTWRVWRYEWQATSGTHRLQARATSADGVVQTAATSGVIPNGATGLPTVQVSVA